MDDMHNQLVTLRTQKQNNMVHQSFINAFLEMSETSTKVIECPVCMENITHTNGMQLASCGHPVCDICFQIIKTQNNACPICRKIFT